MTRVIVLGGGVGGEREVSLAGSRAVADALASNPKFDVSFHEIGLLDADDIEALAPGVVFPVLHGPWGEGGEIQQLLEQHARAFVGAGSLGARLAMDKGRTLECALALGIPICGHQIAQTIPSESPLEFPVVIKPVADGSSVGVRVCRSDSDWRQARESLSRDGDATGPWIIERFASGRELTVSLVDGEPLPIIEIVPSEGFYDYDAKYQSDKTRYVVAPSLDDAAASAVVAHAETIYQDLGLRHLARADFVLGDDGLGRFLEINTMPGFTSHSLLPMAARASGLDLGGLCSRLVDLALRDAKQPMVCR